MSIVYYAEYAECQTMHILFGFVFQTLKALSLPFSLPHSLPLPPLSLSLSTYFLNCHDIIIYASTHPFTWQ